MWWRGNPYLLLLQNEVSRGLDHLESTILKITGKIFGSHLELVILENSRVFVCYLSKLQAKNWLLFKITSSRCQEKNDRLLFFITGIDDQGLL